jgi:hypothetical protein
VDLNYIEANGHTIAEAVSGEAMIHTVQDALDLLATAGYEGASHVLLHEKNLMPGFFDLKSGLAGEILQKFTNYRMGLIIIGDFGKVESGSLRAFIEEANRGRQAAFVPSREAALARLADQEGAGR